MTISVVQQTSQVGNTTGATSQSVSFPSAVTNGNTILVCVIGRISTGTAGLGASDGSNSYTVDIVETAASGDAYIAVLRASSVTGGSLTITVSTTGSGFFQIVALEVSGLSSTIDATQDATTTSSGVVTTGTFSTSNANDLVIVGFSTDAKTNGLNITITSPPSGYTTFDTATADTGAAGQFAYQVVSTTQSSVDPTWNGTHFHNSVGIAIAYEQASGGSPPGTPTGLTVGPDTTNPTTALDLSAGGACGIRI